MQKDEGQCYYEECPIADGSGRDQLDSKTFQTLEMLYWLEKMVSIHGYV